MKQAEPRQQQQQQQQQQQEQFQLPRCRKLNRFIYISIVEGRLRKLSGEVAERRQQRRRPWRHWKRQRRRG